jgi:hypothetical protein
VIVFAAVVPATGLMLLLGMDQFEARLFGSGASVGSTSDAPVPPASPEATEPPAPSAPPAPAPAPSSPDERQ